MGQKIEDQSALITFVRVAELGKVKTRLAADVGDQRALEIYEALLDHTRKVCLESVSKRYLYYATQAIDDNWPSDRFEKKEQQGEDLGKRMSNAFKEVLDQHQKAIIIGSDCPQLNSAIVQKAFDALEKFDVVIGPTFDGGYYLLGMKDYHQFLFENIDWSTPEVFDQTVKKTNKNKLKYKVLQTLSDVDYAEDWEQYGWAI